MSVCVLSLPYQNPAGLENIVQPWEGETVYLVSAWHVSKWWLAARWSHSLWLEFGGLV